MEENNLDCAVTPQTDFEKVVQIIDEARKLHFDNKTPSDIDVEKFYKYAYDKLFGYRDSHQTVLSAPQIHNLVEVFKELKFGRPAEDQRFLQECIQLLDPLKKTVSKQKATIGRIVIYNTTTEDRKKMGEHPSCNVVFELPAVIVNTWNEDIGLINAKVICDGDLELWKTSIKQGDLEGDWNFPVIK